LKENSVYAKISSTFIIIIKLISLSKVHGGRKGSLLFFSLLINSPIHLHFSSVSCLSTSPTICPTLCRAFRSFSDFSYCLVSSFNCSLTLQLPAWIITLWPSTLNKVNRCSDLQNYMVTVFLHLIKPLRLFNGGALRKNVSTLLVQEVRETCVPDGSTTQKTRKDEEGYYDPPMDSSLKLRSGFPPQ